MLLVGVMRHRRRIGRSFIRGRISREERTRAGKHGKEMQNGRKRNTYRVNSDSSTPARYLADSKIAIAPPRPPSTCVLLLLPRRGDDAHARTHIQHAHTYTPLFVLFVSSSSSSSSSSSFRVADTCLNFISENSLKEPTLSLSFVPSALFTFDHQSYVSRALLYKIMPSSLILPKGKEKEREREFALTFPSRK